ncbi:sulfotransferase family protein [Acidithiobacillus ferrooxidans]|nr:sulfotransferase family protein [Acidithiobacillus ferrooxidans]
MEIDMLKTFYSGRLIFHHLEKTAGQAINDWMCRNLGVGTVTPNLIGTHRNLIQRYGGNYPIISAHIQFDGTGLDPRWRYTTVLRDPVDRLISWIYFVDKDVKPTVDNMELKSGAELFLRSNGEETNQAFLESAENPYVQSFSSVVMRCNASWRRKLEAALLVLAEYDLVGDQADLPKFIDQLAKLLLVTNYTSLRAVNVTSSRPQQDSISAQMLRNIHKLTEYDRELYSEIQRIANRQVRNNRYFPTIQPFNFEFQETPPRAYPNVYWLGAYMRQYLAKDLSTQNGAVVGRALVSNGENGYLCYGPYLNLEAGHYCAVANGLWITRGAVCNISICSNKGAVLHAEETLVDSGGATGAEWSQLVNFKLDDERSGIEFRLMVPNETKIQLNAVTFLNEKIMVTILESEIGLCQTDHNVDKQISVRTIIYPAQMISKIALRVGTTLQTTGQDGFLCYGPYMTLNAGLYRVSLVGSIGPQGLGGAYADVVCQAGKKTIHREPMATTPFNNQAGNIIGKPWTISLEQEVSDLEIRLWVSKQTEINLCGILLQRLVETK